MFPVVSNPPETAPSPATAGPSSGGSSGEPPEVLPAREAIVKKWTDRINSAKRRFESDFDRMREDMEFCGGIQWNNQEAVEDHRYRANYVVRQINQSVDSMYARNPKAVARRKQRLDYEFWDGTQEQLMMAAASVNGMTGPPNPMAFLIMDDHQEYLTQKTLLDRLATTLEKEYQVQWDRQEIDLKLQHKQLIRRLKVTGVGYVRISFERVGRQSLSNPSINDTIIDRANRIAQLVHDHNDGKWDKDDARMELLQSLMESVQYSQANPQDTEQIEEYLKWHFYPSTSVIVDPNCKMLKGFVGADWVAIESMLDIDEVRAIFRKPFLSDGAGGAKTYDEKGKEVPGTSTQGSAEKTTKVAVWEVLNKKERNRFFLCDGYKDYLLPPEELQPCVQGFWPIRAITLNDNETEPGLRISIYPESDVRLMTEAQKSINSAREALRKHRRFNRPKWYAAAGVLKDEDKQNLKNPADNEVIEIKGIPQGVDPNTILVAAKTFPIDPPVYDTGVNERDILKTVSASQPPLDLLQPRTTATSTAIAAQQNLQSTSSEVDELDELLTWEARIGSEMLLRERSKQGVMRDVGRGAGIVWPESQQAREEYVDQVYLEVEAASTGRPNKALEVNNFQQLAPLLLQAGASPQFIIREAVKRLDDKLDPTDAFPTPGMMGPPPQPSGVAGAGQPQNQPSTPPSGGPSPAPTPVGGMGMAPSMAPA